MPESNVQTLSQTFKYLGVQTNRAVDNLSPNKFNILKNVRSYVDGVIESRKGMSPINSSAVAGGAIHSYVELNDDTPSAAQTYAHVIGAGTILYSDNTSHNAFVQRDTGFSGNPLSFIPLRPANSAQPYMYVADSSKMVKIQVDSSIAARKWGISAPTTAPSGAIGATARTVIDAMKATTGWTASGGGIRSLSNSAQNITALKYDTGTTGWVNIVPSPYPNHYVEGTMIRFSGTLEDAFIEQTFKPVKSGTIGSITYDSGSTGLCTIVLSSVGRKSLVINNLILINSGGGTQEYCRIQSVTIGDDDTKSIRVSTVNTHAAGETITGVNNFRCYVTNTYTAGVTTIDSSALALACTGATVSYVTKTASLDLSNINGRELQDTDEMCFVLQMVDPQLTTEVQIQLNCDRSTTDFSGNYFIMSFRPSDYTSVVQQTQSSIVIQQLATQRQAVDDQAPNYPVSSTAKRDRLQRRYDRLMRDGAPQDRLTALRRRLDALSSSGTQTNPTSDSPTTDIPTGSVVDVGIKFKLSELKRVGTDTTVGLKDINTIRIAVIAGGTGSDVVTCRFRGWWVGGSFGADVGDIGAPYIWRYRYRSTTTGAISQTSPAMRSGLLPHRDRVQLTPIASSDPQVNAIDWFRFGGSIEEWRYIGTGANSTATFNDDYPDDSIKDRIGLEFDNFVPFPVADLPRTGTCNVTGTKVTRASGDTFNTNWVEGSVIVINGIECHLYTQPSSTTVLEIKENAGTQSGVTWFMPEPIITDTCLPAVWGTFGDGELGLVVFGCGDTYNEGTLYWTKPDQPEVASDKDFLEITNPSEPLMNGFIYDSRAFVFSSENLYAIYPFKDSTGKLKFTSNKTPLNKGIFGRYFFCLSENGIYFGDRDGIYFTQGGSCISITDDDLFNLFPHESQVGSTTNGFVAPDFTSPNNLRLNYYQGYLYFDYLGIDAARHTAVFEEKTKGWIQDEYTPTVLFHAGRTGRGVNALLLCASDGRLYTYTGTGDGALSATAISCQVRTKAENFGDFRAEKILQDVALDVNRNGLTLTTQIYYNNFGFTPASSDNSISSGSGRAIYVLDINSGGGQYGKNFGLDLTWSSATASPSLYGFNYNWIPKKSDLHLASLTPDGDDCGYEGAKWIQGFRIRANSFGVAKSFKVQADNGTNGAWADIQSFDNLNAKTWVNESVQAFSFTTPFTAHLVRIIGLDTDDWHVVNVEWIFEPEPELVTEWIAQPTTFGLKGYGHCHDCLIALRATQAVTLTIAIDGTSYTYTISPDGTNSSNLRKPYAMLQAVKGKVWQFSLTSSTAFRVYQKDIEVNIKSWGENEPYRTIKPFGDISAVAGARI